MHRWFGNYLVNLYDTVDSFTHLFPLYLYVVSCLLSDQGMPMPMHMPEIVRKKPRLKYAHLVFRWLWTQMIWWIAFLFCFKILWNIGFELYRRCHRTMSLWYEPINKHTIRMIRTNKQTYSQGFMSYSTSKRFYPVIHLLHA